MPTKVRDLTDAQYRAALARNGFERSGVLGYVYHRDNPSLHIPPVLKADFSTDRRASLAYAIRRHERAMKEKGAPAR